MRVGPIDRAPQRHDQLRAGQLPPDALGGVFVVQILRARLADRNLAIHARKELLVFAPRLGAEPIFRLPLPPEVVRLLHWTDKHVRVLGQILVERGRATLVRADDEEVRQRHEAALPMSIRRRVYVPATRLDSATARAP